MNIKNLAHDFKREVKVYKMVLQDKRTPFLGKLFLWLAIGYVFLPFDLIPDFIPLLGLVDDVIIVPLLVFAALCFIPKHLIEEYRIKVNK